MINFLNLKIYTPTELFLEEVIYKLNIVGNEGNFTILPKHIDYVSSFDGGVISFEKENGEMLFLGIKQGILVKCGREISISTFFAINGGNNIDNLKCTIENVVKKEKELIEIEKKLQVSLKNIEFELFDTLKNIKKYD